MVKALNVWACLLCCGCLLMTGSLFLSHVQLHQGAKGSRSFEVPPHVPPDTPRRSEARVLSSADPEPQAAAQQSVSGVPVSSGVGEAMALPDRSEREQNYHFADLQDAAAFRPKYNAVINETSEEELLARARARHGRYMRSFEDAVQQGWAKELMHDPYPPPDPSQLRSQHPRHQRSAWDWMFGRRETTVDDGQARTQNVNVNGAQAPQARKAPPPPPQKDSGGIACDFEEGMDYVGKDVGTVEGITDQACCEACARKGDTCTVAVMSSMYDEPPRACWLKTRVLRSVRKDGVRACWPPGQKKAHANLKQ